jgi:DNA-binding IclR family transcriptional regulator
MASGSKARAAAPGEDYQVPAVERAFTLLGLVATGGPQTLAELVERSGLNKSTTFYLVRTLSSLEVLRYDEQTRRYSLGRTLVRLGAAASSSQDEIAATKRAVASLPETFNVTIVLYRRYDVDRVVIVDKVERRSGVTITVDIGAPLPIQGASFGRAFLAFDEPQRVDEALRNGLHPYTVKSLTDAGAFRMELVLVRERGWALDEEGFALGVSTVAAPIFAADGAVSTVVAAVGFTSLLNGDTAERCGTVLRGLCDDLGIPHAQAIGAHRGGIRIAPSSRTVSPLT